MLVGMAITDDIVRQDPRYVSGEVTLSAISAYTLEQQTKYSGDALKTVNGMKEEYGDAISALVRIYNASGETLSLNKSYDWHGHIWKYPMDQTIQNGQWSVFLHVHTSGGFAGASGAAIYRASQAKRDIFLGWESPYIGLNSVYVKSQEFDNWPDKDSWADMYEKIEKAEAYSADTSEVFNINGIAGQNSSPVVDFIITRP